VERSLIGVTALTTAAQEEAGRRMMFWLITVLPQRVPARGQKGEKTAETFRIDRPL